MVAREAGRRVWRIVVLVLVVLDVALVAVVLGARSGSSATTAVTRMTPSASAGPNPTGTSPRPSPSPIVSGPSTSASPSPDPTSTPTVASPVPVRRLLVAVDGRQAWRVATGSCTDGGASVERTTDGGRTWTSGTPPLRSISRLVVPIGSDAVYAVGADGGCDAQLRRTVNSAATWTGANGMDRFFYTDPQHPGSVAVPGAGTVRACGGDPVVDLAVEGVQLEVLCPDGRLRSIGDGDRGWTAGPLVSGAVAVTTSAVDPTRTYVARLGQTGCRGVQIADVTRLGDPITCVRRADPPAPGSVSLAIVGNAGWLLVGDDVYNAATTLDDWAER